MKTFTFTLKNPPGNTSPSWEVTAESLDAAWTIIAKTKSVTSEQAQTFITLKKTS